MMKKVLLTGVFLFIAIFNANAQSAKNDEAAESQNVISHRVEQGETVMLICKKYLVSPDDIYKLNPDAVEGISYNMTLKIPADKRLGSDKKKDTQKITRQPKRPDHDDLSNNR
ncbi:LysM peptidoglycan-binding domain-containing protein [Flavobacterium zepuense]|uniref:LysM peptidoglycan-binding domain-containing protein n=1 Tax=Flavobacterium zepuense TaxID=2593302 RepID=A0A552VAF7_9FLAO|nr:LysM domain-containing protein [Flavobacterium zepuense]TRW27429.1 LysM peptidoglycan-binding domain-containing protein [Flavobacterium zepuense]